MTTAFAAEWQSLDDELTRAAPGQGMVRRRVIDTAQTELHLAVVQPMHQRLLLIRMPNAWDEDLAIFPRWSGLAVGSDRDRAANRRFLVLKQGDSSPPEVFEALAADIISAIRTRAAHPVLPVISERLDRWKTFFAEHDLRGMSIEAQQGLFAELWFLQQHVLPRCQPKQAVDHWTGSKRTNHDFQFAHHAIEIKSSSSKQHLKMHVASEKQLDATGLAGLFVVFLPMNVLRQGGQTLPDLVAAIRTTLASSAAALDTLNQKLIEGGYLDAQATHYKTGFVVRDARCFHVTEGFPRILESDLTPGVGDVAYSIVLAACEPFKASLEDVKAAVLPTAGVTT